MTILGAGVVSRKTECPIYIPERSFMKKEAAFGKCEEVNYIAGGDTVVVGDFSVKAFSTRHDSEGSVGYVVTEISTGKKFGYLTDTGIITRLMRVALEGCDAYFIESDYDDETLSNYDDYTLELRDRIASPYGHLSNDQAVGFVEDSIDLDKTQWILFGHLSPRTNSPDMVKTAIKKTFPNYVETFKLAPTSDPLEIK